MTVGALHGLGVIKENNARGQGENKDGESKKEKKADGDGSDEEAEELEPLTKEDVDKLTDEELGRDLEIFE